MYAIICVSFSCTRVPYGSRHRALGQHLRIFFRCPDGGSLNTLRLFRSCHQHGIEMGMIFLHARGSRNKLSGSAKDMDGRDKPRHDEQEYLSTKPSTSLRAQRSNPSSRVCSGLLRRLRLLAMTTSNNIHSTLSPHPEVLAAGEPRRTGARFRLRCFEAWLCLAP